MLLVWCHVAVVFDAKGKTFRDDATAAAASAKSPSLRGWIAILRCHLGIVHSRRLFVDEIDELQRYVSYIDLYSYHIELP